LLEMPSMLYFSHAKDHGLWQMRCQVVILMVTCFLCQEILRSVLFSWSLDETKRIGRISLLLIYFIPFRRKTKKHCFVCVWEMFLGVRFFSHSLISIYLCKFSYSFILEHLTTPFGYSSHVQVVLSKNELVVYSLISFKWRQTFRTYSVEETEAINRISFSCYQIWKTHLRCFLSFNCFTNEEQGCDMLGLFCCLAFSYLINVVFLLYKYNKISFF